jgi:hypothetical protein
VVTACSGIYEVNPCIRVVLQIHHLPTPPEEKLVVVGCWHRTTSLAPHHLGPLCHGWIMRSMQININSRAQYWNSLEEKTTQDRCKPQVPLSTEFGVCQLDFHVGQQ